MHIWFVECELIQHALSVLLGLDSVSALSVIQLLKEIARGENRASDFSQLQQSRATIITTIHQPSSRIYQSFDLVSVLATGGHQIYFGPAQQAEAVFERQGFPLPQHFNIADYLLEIASLPTEKRPTPIYIEAHDDLKQVHSRGMSQHTVNSLPSDFPPSQRAHQQHLPVISILTQLEVLSKREMKVLLRDKSLLFAHIGLSVVLGIFIGGLYYQTDVSIAGFQVRFSPNRLPSIV